MAAAGLLFPLLIQAAPAAALPPAAAAPPPAGDVVVRGAKPRGSVVGDVPAERVFGPLDLRAYGANDVRELLDALAPQVASGRGRGDEQPVVLLNGRRVSGFAEIAAIPTEAIERMEVFPEEVALRYGYRPDQKVVNVVVFERYSARVGQASLSGPTDGGRDAETASANLLRIRGNGRLSVSAEYARADDLLESRRNVVQPPGLALDAGRFRSLVPETERGVAAATLAGPILGDVAASLNGRFEASRSDSLLGPRDWEGAAGPLRRDADTRAVHLGGSANGRAGDWLWSATGNYDRTRNLALTDRAGAAARDSARAVNALADADLLLSGPLAALPAGPLSATVRASGSVRDFSGRSVVGGVGRDTDLSRDRGAVQLGLDAPLATRGRAGPAWLGNLSLNANLRLEELSDAGTLRTWGVGANWSPVPALNLLATLTREQGAPTVEQLGAPPAVTPGVRFFDFVRGETADVERLSGGNPALPADDRRVLSLGATARPFASADLTVTLDYLDTRVDRPISAFPAATPEIQAAFPDRFARAPDGRLLRFDATPVTFARSQQRQLRWGVNWTRPLGPVPPGARDMRVIFANSPAEAQRMLPPGARVVTQEAGSPAARRYENLSSRLILGLNHSWRLEDRVLVRENGPVLDYLNGSTVDARGGRPRHEVQATAGVFKRGLGARLSATWQSGTEVRGGLAGPLFFSDLATLDLNLFADLGTRLHASAAGRGWARGARLSLGVVNLLNERGQVRDAAGRTPLNYQSAYLNPLGRVVSLSLRKLF